MADGGAVIQHPHPVTGLRMADGEELEADLLRRSFGSDVSEPGDRPSPPVSIDKHSRRSGAWREEQDEESAVGSGGFAVAEQRRAMWGRTDLHVGSAGGRDEEPSAF